MAHFLAIHEAGSLRAASEAIGLTQPALTASLRKLEEELGARLFERTAAGMVPTAQGTVLHRHAVAMRQGGRFVVDEIRALTAGVSGRLRIGAGVAWTTTIIPGVIRTLHERFPVLCIDLVVGVGDQLAGRLVAGDLDVIIAGGAVPVLDHSDFDHIPLADLPMVAIADPASAIAGRNPVTAADLAAARWVGFHEDENIVASANRFMRERTLAPPDFVLRTNSLTALTTFLQGTEFVSVLIAPVVRSSLAARFTELPLAEPLWSMPISIHHRVILRDAPPIATFRALVREAVAP